MKTPEELRDEIQRWSVRELEIAHQKQKFQEAVDAIKIQSGEAMLDAEPDSTNPADLSEKVRRAQCDVDVIAAGMRAAAKRRLAAVETKLRVDIEALQEQSHDLEKERNRIDKNVKKHLEAIEEALCIKVKIEAEVGQPLSRSRELSNQLAVLGEKIARLERRGVSYTTHVELYDFYGTPDDVALAVLATEAACPSAEAILAWYSSCERNAGQSFSGARRRVVVTWKDGVIDAESSYIQALDWWSGSGSPLDMQRVMFRATQAVAQ